MPEVNVSDEIGTELEAQAARTIAERGVQLVGTAHGNTLENLMMNPTLADLIGGIQSVTLGDEEARRRRTQKSILERKSPPTFDIVVEIQDRDRVAIHPDVGDAVDALLRGELASVEVRWFDKSGKVKVEKPSSVSKPIAEKPQAPSDKVSLFLFGVNRSRLEQAAREFDISPNIVHSLKDANMFITSKSFFRRKPQIVKDAEAVNLPVYVLKSNSPPQMRQLLHDIYPVASQKTDRFQQALSEAEQAVEQVRNGKDSVELSPQSSYIRRLQHLVAEKNALASRSLGKDPHRRVMIYRE